MAQAPPSTSGSSQSQQQQSSHQSEYNPAAEAENEALSHYLFIVCATVAALVIVWKAAEHARKYIRKVVCAGNDRQQIFALPHPQLSWIKRHILYAPVLSKRHNREMQLSSAVNVGTLPTRLQLMFLVGYFISNVVFCVVNISFSSSFEEVADLVRNRTGVLSTVNMVSTSKISLISSHKTTNPRIRMQHLHVTRYDRYLYLC